MPVSSIVFHLTERCGRSCLHCLRDPGAEPRDLPVPALERILDQGIALHRVPHVGFTGGEPALHPRLGEVLDAVVGRRLTWHVVTSGSGFDRLLSAIEASEARREGLTLVTLSLDGATAEVHDEVRGPGSYREVMAAALACQAREIPFAIQGTLHALNAGELEAIGLLAAQLGAARVRFAMTQATGSTEDARLRLEPAEWSRLRGRITRLAGILQIPVTATEGFAHAQPFHVCDPWRSEILNVDVRGRLTLCCQLAGVTGGDEDVLADLSEVTLLEAHSRLLDHVHLLQRERLDAAARGEETGWDHFPCNACARRHGKPHWSASGATGPRRPTEP
jgi:MoaA/NifB/PqqE/SkfB family radical SAM enzyme